MQKKIILLPVIGLLLYTVLTSNSGGPGGGLTGGGCSCHNASPTASTSVSMQLLNTSMSPVTMYVAGQSYFIRITGTQTSGSLTLGGFGFQVCAVNASSTSTSAGTMSAATVGSSTVYSSGVNMVQHSGTQSPTTGSGGSGTTYVRH